ncbi:MAG: N-6 DNA methylase, partial [Planctomycetes bacterium]|nr:N-6 DNA methylase [Planctomycetota bacterium]
VEDKPEVKKAGGVYYTPTYIVDYIVKNTVGELLKGNTPRSVEKLKILDPACGSGSFLIGAYQYLLDWHRDYFLEHEPARKKKQIYRTHKGDWRLTTSERKKILLNNIYGVDIDPQAVEVTKLSLLLKVLEGETSETLQRALFAKKRALPDLGNNIKCGNSLIGPDFYDNQQLSLFDEEEALRINAFDWQAEFAEIMRHGGFDAVIGNPPYVRMEMFKEIKQYLRTHFACHAERTDLYVYFIEKEHALLAPRGVFGMIVSNKFIRAKYGEPLRKHLESAATIERIVDLAGLPVFRGATVRTIVLITSRLRSNGRRWVAYSPPPTKEELRQVETGRRPLSDVCDANAYKIRIGELRESGWRLNRPKYAELMDALTAKGTTLKNFMDGNICRGIVSGLTDAFVIGREQRDKIIAANPKAKNIIRPFLQGRQIRRFEIEQSDEFLIYTHHGIDMDPYPAVIEHLRPFRSRLEKRATKQHWYELQQPQFAYAEFLENPKIVFPDIATGCRFALDTAGHFGANTVYFLPTANLPLLGVLNSRLAFFFFQQTCAALEGPGEAYLRFFGQYLEGFPVCLPKSEHPTHDELAQLVEQAQSLREKLKATTTNHKRTIFQRHIDTTDRQIDQLVYELYGLTDEEIQIVEEAAP